MFISEVKKILLKKLLDLMQANSNNYNFDYKTHSISLIGDRSENQDYQIQKTISDSHVMVLTDGMGGHSGGKYAAVYFCKSLFNEILENIESIQKQPESTLSKLVSIAKKIMLAKVENIDKALDPNTTFVSTIISGDRIYVAHLGDSRCMIANNEKLIWQTKDHSMLQLYLDQGLLNELEAQEHPYQSKLLKAVGQSSDDAPDVKIIEFDIADLPLYVFQMTDGFWQGVPDQDLQSEITKFENDMDNIENILDNLANKAVRKTSPGSDNTTVQLCRISKK